ncbi:MAG: type IV toxin-antitoxin system AbiEi family antitoxin domain-containing protein [Candidatus Longimicrobiales bacterium M2_2A_002]
MDRARNPSVDERVAGIAARQQGVVSRAQLLEAGLTRGMIDGRVRRGWLKPLYRGVYVLGSLAGLLRPPRSREMAAVLACGAGSVVSCDSAASLWEIVPQRGDDEPVHITHTGSQRRHPGIRAHRVASLPGTHVAAVAGIPVTAPARTLVDLAGRVSGRDLEQAVARAERLGLVEVPELRALVRSAGRKPGIAALRETLARGDPALTRSAAEERFLALVRQGGLPDPETNVPVGRYEIDFLWPMRGVAVEVDGFAHHSSRRQFEHDRGRDTQLAAEGIQVLRVTWRQLVDRPHSVLVHVARTLALAEARAPRRR